VARLTSPSPPPRPRWVRRGDVAVIALPGRYSVCTLLLGPDAVAAVDVSSTSDVDRILLTLGQIGRSPDQLKLVIPSHLHFDHVLGIEALAVRTGAAVALGQRAWEHVQGRRELRWPSRLTLLRALPTWAMQGLPFPPRADLGQARRFGFPWTKNPFGTLTGPVLGDGEGLPGLPGWRVMVTPGHADEAICLHHPGAGLGDGYGLINGIGLNNQGNGASTGHNIPFFNHGVGVARSAHDIAQSVDLGQQADSHL